MFYIGLVHTDSAESGYSISFPDFPGCVTAGESFEELMAMSKEALGFHAEGMVEDGEALPSPSTLDSIKASEAGFWTDDFADAQVVRVPLVMDTERPKRVNISLRPSLLAAIDQAAAEQGMTRSGYLANAAIRTLG